jgi:tryptophan-rich sensory protein
MSPRENSRAMRRTFITGLLFGLRVVWPVLSVLIGAIAALGLAVGLIEGWSVGESIYFAFVSGLTIGYGDIAARTFAGRTLAIVIGICGVLVTALVAAVAVKAISAVSAQGDGKDDL